MAFTGFVGATIPDGVLNVFAARLSFVWLGILSESRRRTHELSSIPIPIGVCAVHDGGRPTRARSICSATTMRISRIGPTTAIWDELAPSLGRRRELKEVKMLHNGITAHPMRSFGVEPMHRTAACFCRDSAHIVRRPARGGRIRLCRCD